MDLHVGPLVSDMQLKKFVTEVVEAERLVIFNFNFNLIYTSSITWHSLVLDKILLIQFDCINNIMKSSD